MTSQYWGKEEKTLPIQKVCYCRKLKVLLQVTREYIKLLNISKGYRGTYRNYTEVRQAKIIYQSVRSSHFMADETINYRAKEVNVYPEHFKK